MQKSSSLTSAKRTLKKPLAQMDRTLKRVHIVRKGDTLVEIARRYQVSLGRLAVHNNLSHRAKITVGTRLEIP